MWGRLAIGTIGAAVAVAALVAWMLTQSQANALVRAEREVARLAVFLDQHAARTFEAVDVVLRSAVERLSEASVVGRPTADLIADLRAQAELSPQIGIIFMETHDGEVHGNMLSTGESRFLRLRAAVRRGHAVAIPDRLLIEPAAEDPIALGATVVLSRAALDADGAPVAIVAATLDIAYFRGLYAAADLGREGAITLLLQDGTVLLRAPESADPSKRRWADEPPFPGLAQRPAGSFRGIDPIDGKTRIQAYRTIDGYPLVLVAAMSEADVLADWEATAAVEIAVSSGAIALILIAGLTTAGAFRRAELAQRDASGSMRAAAFLHHVTAAANEARSLDAAVDASVTAFVAHLGWAAGTAHLRLPGRDVAEATDLVVRTDRAALAIFERATRATVVQEAAALFAQFRGNDGPLWIDDLREAHWTLRRDAARACRIGATVVVPVRARGSLIGVVQLYDDRPRPPDATVIELAAYVGDQLGLVAERARSDQEVRDREARLASLYDAVRDAIVTLSTEGRIEAMNPAAARLFDRPAASTVGRDVATIMAEPVRVGTALEGTGLRRDGGTFPIELSVSEMPVGDRRMLVAVVRDVSERKRFERLKDEFLSTVSHELRTPLTSIVGSLGLLLGGAGGDLADKARHLVGIAKRNGDRLILLLNDILDLERIAAGRMEFVFEAVDPVAIVADAIEQSRPFAEAHGITLTLDAAATPAARADGHRIAQVLTNLLSNAVKFSPPGSEVTVRVADEGRSVRVSVVDRGRGIPEAFRDRIFQRFAQADAGDARTKGGTGLGLSIVRSIVEQHGGRLGYESEEGAGSTFWFELPRHGTEMDDAAA
jgi:PAS domain S-box-containing protein